MFAPVLVISSRWESAEQQFIAPIDPPKTPNESPEAFRGTKSMSTYREVILPLRAYETFIVISILAHQGVQHAHRQQSEVEVTIKREYAPIDFIVNRPPNISDSVDYERFMTMLQRLERLPESYGYERSLLWLRDYDVM
uniref:Uncharacterized protein n=1 Tax=Parascaris equorum TaxID=6256 RepID=A0A914RZU1_PAREQ